MKLSRKLKLSSKGPASTSCPGALPRSRRPWVELTHLGVVTIGDRVRLWDICRKEVQHADAAAGVQERPSTSTSIPSRRSYPDILRERASLFSSRGSRSRGGGNRRHELAASNRKKIPRPWTVQLYYLSSKFAFKVPTQAEKEILHNAGLGLRKI